jgi:uncharacterized protein
MLSVVDGKVEACTELLNLGADVSIADSSVPDWKNVLFIAAELGRAEFIDILLRKGADLSITNRGGKDCMWYALHAPDAPTTLRHLLRVGATLRAKNARTGISLMHVAAQEGRSAAIDALASHGQDIEMKDAHGETPLFAAIRHGHLSTVSHMVHHLNADPGKENDLGQRPLHVAAQILEPKIASCILDAGAEVDARDNLHRTSLMIACGVGSKDWAGSPGAERHDFSERLSLVHVFLNAAAKVGARSRRGLCPLHFAAICGREDVVRLLLLRGASPSRRTKRGRTALHLAALEGHSEVIYALAKHSVELDARDDRGCTALYCACARGHIGAVRVLLELGSSMDWAPNHLGRTPLVTAARAGRLAVVRLLIDRGHKLGISLDLALLAANRHCKMDIVAELITYTEHHAGSQYSPRPLPTGESMDLCKSKSGFRDGITLDATIQSPRGIVGRASKRCNAEIVDLSGSREYCRGEFCTDAEHFVERKFLEYDEKALIFDLIGFGLRAADRTDKLSRTGTMDLCNAMFSAELNIAREVQIFGKLYCYPYYRKSYDIYTRVPIL